MSLGRRWICLVLALLAVTGAAPAQPEPDTLADQSALSIPPGRRQPRPKSTVDPRAALGPPAAALAAPETAPDALPTPLARADGLPFSCTVMGLVDVGTGEILYGHNLTARRHPASTTKILTTLVALEAIEAGTAKLTDRVKVSKAAATTPESGLWLQEGETMTLHDLLVGVMVRSANDASRAVAEYVGGGDAAKFVEQMNARAQELGAVDTHFVNPHGLHMGLDGSAKAGDDHYTCGYDLLLFTMQAWRHPFFRELCLMNGQPVSWEQLATPTAVRQPPPKRTQSGRPVAAQSPPPAHPDWRIISNRNQLLTRYDECIGVKTGYTKQAGACLVSAALRGDRAVLAVTMQSASGGDRWIEAEALLRYGLDNYRTVELLNTSQPLATVPVRWGRMPDVVVQAAQPLSLLVHVAAPRPVVERRLVAEVSAPVAEGDNLGSATVSLPSGRRQEVPLVAAAAVGRNPFLSVLWLGGGTLVVATVGAGVYGASAKAARRRRRVLKAKGGGTDRRRSRPR